MPYFYSVSQHANLIINNPNITHQATYKEPYIQYQNLTIYIPRENPKYMNMQVNELEDLIDKFHMLKTIKNINDLRGKLSERGIQQIPLNSEKIQDFRDIWHAYATKNLQQDGTYHKDDEHLSRGEDFELKFEEDSILMTELKKTAQEIRGIELEQDNYTCCVYRGNPILEARHGCGTHFDDDYSIFFLVNLTSFPEEYITADNNPTIFSNSYEYPQEIKRYLRYNAPSYIKNVLKDSFKNYPNLVHNALPNHIAICLGGELGYDEDATQDEYGYNQQLTGLKHAVMHRGSGLDRAKEQGLSDLLSKIPYDNILVRFFPKNAGKNPNTND